MTANRNNPATVKKKQTRLRISKEMRECVELMATRGLPLPQAAELSNITKDSAARAMKKSHVLALLNQRVKDVRDNAAQMAYLRINHQAMTAGNARLRFDANRWVAGVDGISPVQKVQGQHQHSHSFTGFSYPDLDTIEGTTGDTKSPADD